MISLKIGSSERQGDNITERWIAQQIRKRKKDSQPVCVQMNIKKGDVDVHLDSGACQNGIGGGGRKPNHKEFKLLDLWKKKGLDGKDINPGMLISFLKQYERYC